MTNSWYREFPLLDNDIKKKKENCFAFLLSPFYVSVDALLQIKMLFLLWQKLFQNNLQSLKYLTFLRRSSSLSADVKSTDSSLSVSFGGNVEAIINLDFQFRGEVWSAKFLSRCCCFFCHESTSHHKSISPHILEFDWFSFRCLLQKLPEQFDFMAGVLDIIDVCKVLRITDVYSIVKGWSKSLWKMSSYPARHHRHQSDYFRKCWNWGGKNANTVSLSLFLFRDGDTVEECCKTNIWAF